MTDKIDDLVEKMKQARDKLNEAMEKAAPQLDIYPSWKLKQLMDHITGWDELVASAFRTHSQGAQPALVVKHGIDKYNVDSVHARENFSLEESCQAYAGARLEVFKALYEIPPEKISQKFQAPWGGKCTVASVLKIFISHEREHAKAIEERLKEPTGSV